MSLVLILGLLLQDDFARRLEEAMTHLSAEKIEARDAARKKLVELAKTDRKAARTVLKARWETEKDTEVKAAIGDVLSGLGPKLDDVTMEIVFPKAEVTASEAQSSKFKFKIRVTNTDDAEAVLIRHWTIEVLKGKKQKVDPSLAIGMGRRAPECALAACGYLVVPPGKSVETEEGLARYFGDTEHMMGYTLTQEGEYTVRLTYRHARPGRCFQNCADHADPAKPWNLALEGEKTFEAKLVVRKETEKDKEEAAERTKRLEARIDELVKNNGGKIPEKEFARLMEEFEPDEVTRAMFKKAGVKMPGTDR